MYFQDEVGGSGKKKKKRWFYPRDLENWFFVSASKIMNHFGFVLSEINESIAWLCMQEWVAWQCKLKGWEVPDKRVSACSWHSKNLPASANSFTFSPCALSVTVQLLGPFAWDRCQAGEVALTMLPHVQKSWKNSPLLVEGEHERSQTDLSLICIFVNTSVDSCHARGIKKTQYQNTVF